MDARRNYCRISIVSGVLFFGLVAYSIPVFAEQWKPLCIDGSSCKAPYQVQLGGGRGGYSPIDSLAAGPLVTSQGILLHHTPLDLEPCPTCAPRRHVLQLTTNSLEDLGGEFLYVSDVNALETPSGRKLAWNVFAVRAWNEPEDGVEIIDYTGLDTVSFNSAFLTGPPVAVADSLYIGIGFGGGQAIYVSNDDGDTWTHYGSNIGIGADRYNLMANPEENGLWAIQSTINDDGGLWESEDGGKTWYRVDDGTFPTDAVRILIDSDNQNSSFAITPGGLFTSNDRGTSWRLTSLTEPVHGLVFVEVGLTDEEDQSDPARILVAGTDTGVVVSYDEAENWENLSQGLLAQPYTVTWAHGYLLATGNSGYFTCNSLDCLGSSQVMAPEEDRGIVDIIEFYNAGLNHYFITGEGYESDLLDNGGAGGGWERTGESFKAWSLGGDESASDVCRFYGSVEPGPNSHFYTSSAPECKFLMDLQETIPDNRPRWNFEGYVFSIAPPTLDEVRPCPESTIPIYRAYNDGHDRGIDSNHRYMMNPNLLIEMESEGWIAEGVVFCSPESIE